MDSGYISIIILAIAIIFYVTELLPIPIVAMSSAALMVIFGVIPAETAWGAFSQNSVLIMAGVILMGSTLFTTGAAGVLGEVLIKIAGGKPKLSILLMLTAAGVMSFVMNNTMCTVLFLPLILSVVVRAKDESIYEQKYMQILVIMTSTGGLMTLVGSGVNVASSGMLEASGYDPFTFTQFSKVALPLFIMVLVYTFTIGDKYADKIFGKNRKHSDFVNEFIMQQQKEDLEAVEINVIDAGAQKEATRRKTTSAVIMLAAILGFLTEKYHGVSLGTIAVTGGLLTVITKCITFKEMVQKISWSTLLFLGGTIGCAAGLAQSGGGQIIADFFINLFGKSVTPIIVFIVMSLIAGVITQFMSNTGSCGIMIPIGVSLAAGIGMNPLPVAIGIVLCASCSFVTPMASPTTALVIDWGSYNFKDYIKYSGPITLLLNIMILVLVPLYFPLK
ncbi:MAG: SLC13 family permease [Eubacteriales bacterium]